MKSKVVYRARDYNGIASQYDRVREMSDQNLDLWIQEIIRLGQLHGESVVLGVGCGTGWQASGQRRYLAGQRDVIAIELPNVKPKPSR
jgi:ubiquinone/menaquinone biosynthesis C-methylase UbiE